MGAGLRERMGLCSDGACATGSKEFRASDDQVNGKDEPFAHGAKATTIGLAGKTARKARSERQFMNSPSTGTHLKLILKKNSKKLAGKSGGLVDDC